MEFRCEGGEVTSWKRMTEERCTHASFRNAFLRTLFSSLRIRWPTSLLSCSLFCCCCCFPPLLFVSPSLLLRGASISSFFFCCIESIFALQFGKGSNQVNDDRTRNDSPHYCHYSHLIVAIFLKVLRTFRQQILRSNIRTV